MILRVTSKLAGICLEHRGRRWIVVWSFVCKTFAGKIVFGAKIFCDLPVRLDFLNLIANSPSTLVFSFCN